MQLATLRVYVGSEPTPTGQAPVLVLDDGDERIILRTDGDGDWVRLGLARLRKTVDGLLSDMLVLR